MDFSPTKEQAEFKELVMRFARAELNEGARERERAGEFSRPLWDKCAAFGLTGLSLPQEYGGLELDIVTCLLAMEGLGYACEDSGLVFALNTQLWTCGQPLARFGSAEQKRRWLPGLVRGELIGGHAMTEAGSGSDAFGLRTAARRDGDSWVLDGTKLFITNAPIADLLIVFAVTDKARGFAGVSAFLVEKGTPGFSTGRPIEKVGLRTSPLSEVVLEGCRVPAGNLLGREGGGAAIFNAEMEWERSCLFATHLGAMERVLEETVAYAKARTQFGREIGKFQAVSHKIADMRVRAELSRLILYKVAAMKGEGGRAPVESAIAKLFVSESYLQTCLDALQIHGAYGLTTEYDVERHLRDALAGRIYSGSSEIQRNIIATLMGL